MTEQDKTKVSSLLDDHDPAITALYRASAQEQPPASLDDRILRAAHAAVTTQEETPVVHKPRRAWPMLGGVAASVLVAVLAVKLLPHSLQTPAPEKKERSDSGTLETDRPAAKYAAPAASSEPMPASPAAAPEQQLLNEAVKPSQTDEEQRAVERASAPGMDTDRAMGKMTDAITETPAIADADSTMTANEEFKNIVGLWTTGQTDEAIEKFSTFQKQFPDFTPSASDLAVFEALQAQSRTQMQPAEKPTPSE